MASNYTVQSVSPTTQLTGGNKIEAVQEFDIITKPSGVYFQFRRPVSQLAKLSPDDRSALIASVADQLSTRIEAVMAEPNVQAILYSQPTNVAGQLIDVMTIYVTSDSGNSDGVVSVPLAEIGPGEYTTSRIKAEVDALNDAEGL